MTAPKAQPPSKVTVAFVVERETKRTVRYSELVEGDAEPKIGTLYVHKTAFNGPGFPPALQVTLEW